MNKNDIQKFWGWEREIVNEDYCGKILHLNYGFRSSMHYHKTKDETFLVVSGCVLVEFYDFYVILNHYDNIRVLPGTYHRFWGHTNTKTEFVEFSTHHNDSDSYRIEKSSSFTIEELEQMKSIKPNRTKDFCNV